MYAQSYHCGFWFSCFLVLWGSERTVGLEEWLPDLQPTGTVPDRPAPYRQYGVRQDPWTLHPRSLWSPWPHVQPHHEEQHAYRSVGRCSIRGSNSHPNYCLFLYLGGKVIWLRPIIVFFYLRDRRVGLRIMACCSLFLPQGSSAMTNNSLFLPQRSESGLKGYDQL